MRFTPEHVIKIIDRQKWETRRLWQEGWNSVYDFSDEGIPYYDENGDNVIKAIFDRNGRLKFEVGR